MVPQSALWFRKWSLGSFFFLVRYGSHVYMLPQPASTGSSAMAKTQQTPRPTNLLARVGYRVHPRTVKATEQSEDTEQKTQSAHRATMVILHTVEFTHATQTFPSATSTNANKLVRLPSE